MARILLVEDDPRTVELVCALLRSGGHAPHAATTAGAALRHLDAHGDDVDLVVLDLGLPDRDGLELCAAIREVSAVPILILTARGGADDRVDGLRLGADDYLGKPYDPRELLARIDAIGRRSEWTATGAALRVGPLHLDPGQRSAEYDGVPMDLTAAEFDILRVLAERAGRAVSRERLALMARGASWGHFDRALDVHVSRIRKKLGQPDLIRTVRGVGYLLVGP